MQMKSNRSRVRRTPAVLALIAVIMVAGCATDLTVLSNPQRNSQINFLSSAATIRVEVEVYKGPLSKEPAVQVAELKGIVDDSMRAMHNLKENMVYLQDVFRCNPNGEKKQECNQLKQVIDDISTGKDKYNILENAFFSPDPNHSNIQKCGLYSLKKKESSVVNRNLCRRLLYQVSTYGSYLTRRAAYWASDQAVPRTKEMPYLQIEIANFALVAAEYGNQIVSRADALLQQVEGAHGIGILSEQLPNSIYLRDSEPTAYLDLQAAYLKSTFLTPTWWTRLWRRTVRKATDRARIVERLIADNYWSHINTVFAAGQGDVSMALVKDDIGNWNVKSFDNNPEKLLGAYKDLGLAVVERLTGEVNNILNKEDPIDLANTFNSANQIALGSTGSGRATETKERLAAMRRETARLIMEIGKNSTGGEQQDAAVAQIRQLLKLHSELVSAMAVTTAEAASPPDAMQSLTETDTDRN